MTTLNVGTGDITGPDGGMAADRWLDQLITADDAFHQWCDEESRDPEDAESLADYEAWCDDQQCNAQLEREFYT